MHPTILNWPKPALCAFSVGLALSSPVTLAQQTTASLVPKLPYDSVFTGYQGFADQAIAPWRASNDAVEKAGGWRAYAREASLPDVTDKAATKAQKVELLPAEKKTP